MDNDDNDDNRITVTILITKTRTEKKSNDTPSSIHAKILLGNSLVFIIRSGLPSASLKSGFHNYRFEAALNTEPPFAYQNL